MSNARVQEFDLFTKRVLCLLSFYVPKTLTLSVNNKLCGVTSEAPASHMVLYDLQGGGN